MELFIQTPTKALNKAYLKEKVSREQIELLKQQLTQLFAKVKLDQSEDTLKDFITEFLRNTWYNPNHAITVNNDRKDLAIHTGKQVKDAVGIIIETKKTGSLEMISEAKPNVKALHELILYYLQERNRNNNEIKHLVATDVNNWIVIDANEFDKKIFGNTRVKKLYEVYNNDGKDNPFFYNELKKILDETADTIAATAFDISAFKKIISNEDKTDDRKLIALYKILSPSHLLKLPFANDSNSLDKDFYAELLHIIGLEEIKDGGKKLIQRKKEYSEASFLENAIIKIKDKDCLRDLPELTGYGLTENEQVYNIALELCITWINRILFLKLLEAQLVAYNNNRRDVLFLNSSFITDFDELNNLFFQVLAEKDDQRRPRLKEKFAKVPYLNSSLFERTDLERRTIDISALDNSLILQLHPKTVLKDNSGNRQTVHLPALAYLFTFLDSYDFTSEGKEEIQEENKTLINASVLGLIFEKINGYKDGSFFTPGFITMYMCREILRKTVLQKFNETNGWSCKSFEELQEKIDYTDKEKRQQANDLINSVTVCDPAVGSGHFLVSALNELIAVKHDLRILQYHHNGQRIREYDIEIVNDELILQQKETEEFFQYHLNQKGHIINSLQELQETLFHEKETIIENCLFGVDINTNSVKICRLRLWIELLKNAYYTKDSNYTRLETLPNIDINIKQGNSLISRFTLDSDLGTTLQKSKWSIESYRLAVQSYRNAKSKEEKREMEELIDTIKKDFRSEISTYDPINKKLSKLRGELAHLQQADLFSIDLKKKNKATKELDKYSREIEKLEKEKTEIQTNAIYKKAFEWRFEFPEVLNNDGTYTGFDAIIGNPPYIQLQKMGAESDILSKQNFETFAKTGDIYQLFYELGVNLLKPQGHLCYITSNKWMRTDYGSSTRKFLAEKCNTELVVDFGMAQMFDAATTYTNILILNKENATDSITMCRIKDDYDISILLEDYVTYAGVEISNPGSSSWVAYNKNEYALIKKIVAGGIQLKSWNIQINYGLKTGLNEAFIINTEIKNKLVAEDPRSSDIIKPILRGEDVKAYTPDWKNLWLINTHNGVKASDISRIDAEKDYPAVYSWLLTFEQQLIKRQDKGDHWSNLRNCAYLEEFYKPKIIYPNMTKFMPFVYDKHQFFTNQKCFIVTGSRLAYLTAFFNSKIFRFAFKEYFPELLGDTRELSKIFFETVTVKEITDHENVIYEDLVNDIQEKKKKGEDTYLQEQEIEDRIARHYSLTENDLALINSSEKPSFPKNSRMSERSDSVSIY